MSAPYKISSEPDSLVLAWLDPLDNGGCPVTGYAIFRDDSIGGDVDVEINEDNDPLIRDIAILK